MFRNAFQNGPLVEVFDSKANPKSQSSHAVCKPNKETSARRFFDKELKSYLIELQGYGAKLNFPRDDSKELGLMQNYLVIQLYIEMDQPWSIELGITDTSKTKRRVMISNVPGKLQKKFFHARCHYEMIRKDIWLNLAINLYSFMTAFKGQTFRSLDQVSIGSHCRLRRMFTMKERLIEISNEEDMYADRHTFGVYVPKNYAYPPNILYANQVIDFIDDVESSPSKEVILPPIKKMMLDSRPFEMKISEPRFSQKLVVESTRVPRRKITQKMERIELEKKSLAYRKPSQENIGEEIKIKHSRIKSKDKKKLQPKPKEEFFLSDLEQTKSRLMAIAGEKVGTQEQPVSRPTQKSQKQQPSQTHPSSQLQGGSDQKKVVQPIKVSRSQQKEKKKPNRTQGPSPKKEIIEEIQEWDNRQPEEQRFKNQFQEGFKGHSDEEDDEAYYKERVEAIKARVQHAGRQFSQLE